MSNLTRLKAAVRRHQDQSEGIGSWAKGFLANNGGRVAHIGAALFGLGELDDATGIASLLGDYLKTHKMKGLDPENPQLKKLTLEVVNSKGSEASKRALKDYLQGKGCDWKKEKFYAKLLA